VILSRTLNDPTLRPLKHLNRGRAGGDRRTHTIVASAQTHWSDVGSGQTSVVVGPNTTVTPIDTPKFSPRRVARFAFGSSVPNVSFECRLDPSGAAPWEQPCTRAVVGGLTDGPHRLEVAARAPTGQVDPSPVSYDWTVDTVPPDTAISGPANGFVDTRSDVTFEFSSPEAGAVFRCSVDQAPFVACPGGRSIRLVGLPNGTHSLRTQAIDRAGNLDPSPALRSWRTAHSSIVDNDGDGDPLGRDCDDTNPRRFHGNREKPRNRNDEDCDGKDGRFPDLPSSISIRYSGASGGVRVTSLVVANVLPDTDITVRCRSTSCPFHRFTRHASKRRKAVALGRRFRGATLTRGTRIEVRVVKPEMLGMVRIDRVTRRLTIDDHKRLCLEPRRLGQREGHIDTSIRPRRERGNEDCR
jgi:hypothetical protein